MPSKYGGGGMHNSTHSQPGKCVDKSGLFHNPDAWPPRGKSPVCI
jgi:hypothetical protein